MAEKGMMKTNNTYYDGTKLLSMTDINGNKPEIYICTGNRTAGKTVYFTRLIFNRYLKKGEKFIVLYRYTYELDDVAEKLFGDVSKLFFQGLELKSVKKNKGQYTELHLIRNHDDTTSEICGYAIALNCADSVRKMSHIFTEVTSILFDEFQSESGKYVPNEITKFISIHTSIARGRGEMVRYVPVYMISNAVSMINPYYTNLGISTRLRNDTKFLRGDGFVLENTFNETASKMQKTSSFNRAFANDKYIQYSSENVYLADNQTFIEMPQTSKNFYHCTLKYMDKYYGVREYYEDGIIFVSESADKHAKLKIAVTLDDMTPNYLTQVKYDAVIDSYRRYYLKGIVRFSSLESKECFLKFISY